jgi:hypothetical protein
MMMAGVLPSPQERAMNRFERRLMRMQNQGKEQLKLMELIARRERGEDGTKPMPFAKTIEVDQ